MSSAQNSSINSGHLEVFRYCPKCGGKLRPADHDEQTMPTCSNMECGFIFWQNSKPCVVAIIFNDDGYVLMTTRGMDPDKGKLDLPGGFVMLGELPEDATVREVAEELGVDVAVSTFLGFAVDEYFYQGYRETTLIAGYVAQIISGKPFVADSNEISGIEWVDPANFDPTKLAFTCNDKFLRLAAKL